MRSDMRAGSRGGIGWWIQGDQGEWSVFGGAERMAWSSCWSAAAEVRLEERELCPGMPKWRLRWCGAGGGSMISRTAACISG
ncbi:MAG: hypothetical protein ACKPJD_11655, partial [Planctomycetaceae bacterium]